MAIYFKNPLHGVKIPKVEREKEYQQKQVGKALIAVSEEVRYLGTVCGYGASLKQKQMELSNQFVYLLKGKRAYYD